MSWPDGGTTPFRGEKNTNWEGGYRVPALIRWPGVIEPGTIEAGEAFEVFPGPREVRIDELFRATASLRCAA